MFLFKKIVSQFLMPLSASTLLILGGLLLLWFSRRQQTLGKVLVSIGLALLLICSYVWPAGYLLRPLERTFPALDVEQPLDPAPRYVMVLGSGNISDPALPLTSQLDEAAVIRLVEGIRIQRRYPGSRLIVSGGDRYDIHAHASQLARLAQDLGVPAEEIILLTEPDDTEQEAAQAAAIVGSEPLVLVTSASHMRRAMAIFEAAGMQPVAAPTVHRIKEGPITEFWPGTAFPQPRNLENATRAVYEYLGYVWGRLIGAL
ncbi:MAG: DUF218 domain-containing protein [Chloroflexi bacterium]|nr:DUF218 domain-containing protein [Chloroflexota bacterium]